MSASLSHEVHKAFEFLDLISDDAVVRGRVEGDARAPVERSPLRHAVTKLLHDAIRPMMPLAEGKVRVTENRARRAAPRCARRRNDGENRGLGRSIVEAIAAIRAGTVLATSGDDVTMIVFSAARPAA